jgi:hypothetical protein
MTPVTDRPDFLGWIEEQSALLRAGRVDELDLEQIAEELEEMSKEQQLALQSLMRQILLHLLKLHLSPAHSPRTKWIEEVIEFRDQARARIEATPSLKHDAPEPFAKAWPQARSAVRKSFELFGGSANVPEVCPYSVEQVLEPDYFPRSGDRIPNTLR